MYTGKEPASVRPVDNATQATFYREALAMAFCQPNVTTFLFFHAVDESNLDRWQSGMYYVDGTPKPSLHGRRRRDTRHARRRDREVLRTLAVAEGRRSSTREASR